jgi:hypothetical protein
MLLIILKDGGIKNKIFTRRYLCLFLFPTNPYVVFELGKDLWEISEFLFELKKPFNINISLDEVDQLIKKSEAFN